MKDGGKPCVTSVTIIFIEETVSEALADIFSQLGVPEEILSDLETQFVSDCPTTLCGMV